MPWIKDNTNKFASPFNMSIDSSRTIFEWLMLEENLHRGRRATAAMTGGGERFPWFIFTDGKIPCSCANGLWTHL